MLAGIAGIAGCGRSATGVRTNGCTAVVSGHSGGRSEVTFTVDGVDTAAADAVEAAIGSWNGAGTNVVLRPVPANGTITFVASNQPTHAVGCSGLNPRSVTIYLNRHRFRADAGKRSLITLVARQIGHALGLADGGGCAALMNLRPCAARHVAPGPAEVAKINALYPRG
jgi:hypothetical protein